MTSTESLLLLLLILAVWLIIGGLYIFYKLSRMEIDNTKLTGVECVILGPILFLLIFVWRLK